MYKMTESTALILYFSGLFCGNKMQDILHSFKIVRDKFTCSLSKSYGFIGINTPQLLSAALVIGCTTKFVNIDLLMLLYFFIQKF